MNEEIMNAVNALFDNGYTFRQIADELHAVGVEIVSDQKNGEV